MDPTLLRVSEQSSEHNLSTVRDLTDSAIALPVRQHKDTLEVQVARHRIALLMRQSNSLLPA